MQSPEVKKKKKKRCSVINEPHCARVTSASPPLSFLLDALDARYAMRSLP